MTSHSPQNLRVGIFLTVIALILPLSLPAQNLSPQTPIIGVESLTYPVYAENGMVASQHYLATHVGLEVLKKGGNAIDAAVATAFALAVVLPQAGNLGGGGFMLIHLDNGDTLALDYREMAPNAAHRDLFLDANGNVDSNLSRFSHRAAGVPGTVAGMHHAWSEYGSLPWKKLLAPAIALAAKGFPVSRELHNALTRARHLRQNPASRKIFYRADGTVPAVGSLLVQKNLAQTLRAIAKHGADAFYRGSIARAIVAEMSVGGGLITADDLSAYHIVERVPVRGTYQGFEIVSMPPPSSGGIHLIQMLNILEGYDLRDGGKNSAQTLHLMAEAMKPAYADRSVHLGDPDFYTVPTEWLLSKTYAAQLRTQINPHRARPSADIRAGFPDDSESSQTTHFSIVDRHGNAVSNTYTLNFSYGSGITVPGTGMLLNNEMDDFAAKPGVANAYGLLGSHANAIAGGKRPLSSMTPTLVFEDGQLRLVTGSPGGGRIITTVLQHILDLIDFDLNIAESAQAPRIHHQWQPPLLSHEHGISPDTLKLLTQMGHVLRQVPPNCSLQSVALAADGTLMGASDPRRPDGLAAGY